VGIVVAWLRGGDPFVLTVTGFLIGLMCMYGAALLILAGAPSELVRTTGTYMLLTIATAGVYKTYYVLSQESFDQHTDSYWAYDLIDHRTFTADRHVCISAILCPAARWAHTLTSHKVAKYASFWQIVLVFTMLGSLSTAGVMQALPINAAVVFAGAVSCIFLAILVAGRQRIRMVYEIPAGGWTIAEDALTWACCFPCAMLQEAHQVSRVDPDPPQAEEPALAVPDFVEEGVGQAPCLGGWLYQCKAPAPPPCSPSPSRAGSTVSYAGAA